MRVSDVVVGYVVVASFVCAQALAANEAFYMGSGTSSFTNKSVWKDGYVPQSGDTAVFLPSGASTLTIPTGSPFTLASILANTNGADYAVGFNGETNTLVAPAVIAVSNGTLSVLTGALAGSDGFTFSGRNGSISLQTVNVFTGPVSVLSGRVMAKYDESLGPAPAALDTASITLNGGMLGNVSGGLTLAPTRGITAGPNGAYFSARVDVNPLLPGLVIAPPITGVGSVTTVHQASGVMFSNPDNNYAGDTIFGANTPVGASFGSATEYASLTLGADEVIPDTSSLVFPNGHDGLLNLNGHQETVKGIVASNSVFAIENKNPESPGVLHTPIPDAPMNASIGAGVTLDLVGPGTARFNDTMHAKYLASTGTLALSNGVLAFSDPARLGTITLALNTTDLILEAHQPGLAEYRFSLANGIVNTNAINGAFLGVFPVLRWASTEIPHATAFGLTTQYLYEGEWHVPTDATYSFGKAFDDSACLIIDGQTLIYSTSASDIVIKKNVFLAAGWHTVRLYFANGSGNSSPVGPLSANGFASGILYDPANGNITNSLGLAENAYAFADPGNGSILRTLATPAAVTARARLNMNTDTTFDRSAAPGTSLVWAADIVAEPGATLTVSGGLEPFTVGSSGRPAIFDVDVADANGVRFQDKVWLKKMPANHVYGMHADLAVGVPGILGTGAQTLSAYSLRIPSADALGDPTAASILVNTGRTLTFDSTTELNSYLLNDPDRVFTASNAVTLAGGTLAFDGPGAITLDAPINGSGALLKLGAGTAVLAQPSTFSGSVIVSNGTLAVLNDAALGNVGNPLALNGGTLDLSALALFSHNIQFTSNSAFVFPETSFVLSGVLSGALTKTGTSLLTLAGSAPNPAFDIYVSEGAVTLAKAPGPAARNILGVDAGASLTLDCANPISGSVLLSGGVLDLAGHDLAVDSFRAYTLSVVTNSAASTVKLTVGTNNTEGLVIGAIAPNIAFEKQGTNNFTLAAVPDTSAPSSVNVAAGTLALGHAPSYVRLTILKTHIAGNKPRLGEIVLTRNGYPLLYRSDVTATASSWQAPYAASGAVDGTTSDFWLANGSDNQFIVVSLKEPTIFDGYRLYSGTNDTSKAAAVNNPVSWRLEISSDNTNWILADAVENAVHYSTNPGVKIYDRTLDPAAWPSVAFDAAATIHVAAGATLQAAAPTAAPAGMLSGAGIVDFLRGASATFEDVTGFTGTYMGAGEMIISGTAPFDIPGSAVPSALSGRLYGTGTVNFPPVFPTIRNAAPAVVMVGASDADGSFAGCLAEAVTSLGLTKVGTGKTTILDAGSTYTGDTVIQSGTLAVNAGAYKFRYVKFNVTAAQNDGKDPYGYEMAFSEFQLMRNSQPVAWPSGTTATAPNKTTHAEDVPGRAIDGLLTTRWLTGVLQALTVDTQSGVIFDAYRVNEAGNSAAEYGRCPKTWTVEGSDDGVNWTIVDAQSNVPTPPYGVGLPTGALVGTFQLRYSSRAWLPAQFYAGASATNQFLTAVVASNFCFQVLGVRNETNTIASSGSGYSLTELTLLRNGEVVPWPAGTTAWSPAPGFSTDIGNPLNLVNNDEVATLANRFYSSAIFNPVVISTPTNLTFDAYRWTTASGVPGRDPTHWRLMVMPSVGSGAAHLVDEQVNYPTPDGSSKLVGPFLIRQPAGLSAVNTIPDNSRVRIAQGATLELGAGAIETVGPLSGTGTVSLASGATLGINLVEDAVFDGMINGTRCTLALAGDHAQSFTSVNTIPGDFTVAFQGGQFGGTLHVGGALTISGPVAFAQPASFPARTLLFTYNSMDAASRASLIAGADSISLPAGMAVKVTITDTFAVLSIDSPGTVILLQ